MAMEKQFEIAQLYRGCITATGLNVFRREIFVGYDDGVVKVINCDSGVECKTYSEREHSGIVTSFLYLEVIKLIASTGNDGYFVLYAPGGGCIDKVRLGCPVYGSCLNKRKHEIIFSVFGGLRFHKIDYALSTGHLITRRPQYVAMFHSDVAKCVHCDEGRVYSAGFDRRLIFYEIPFSIENQCRLVTLVRHAHDAGISILTVGKDSEDHNTWILTGSFDKSIKVWGDDGKPLLTITDGIVGPVTGLCYVEKCKSIWVACGGMYATLFDPKTGENVTDYVVTFHQGSINTFKLHGLSYFTETSQIVSSTNWRHLLVWKYNPSSCTVVLKTNAAVQGLAYTSKRPILIFTGGSDGNFLKLERNQSSVLQYGKETFSLAETAVKKGVKAVKFRASSMSVSPNDDRTTDNEDDRATNRGVATSGDAAGDGRRRPKTAPGRLGVKTGRPDDETGRLGVKTGRMGDKTSNRGNGVVPRKSWSAPPQKARPDSKKSSALPAAGLSITRCAFVDELDLLILATEKGDIFVWGSDLDALDRATEVSLEQVEKMKALMKRYSILLVPPPPPPRRRTFSSRQGSSKTTKTTNTGLSVGQDSCSLRRRLKRDNDQVRNRIAGFICKYVLQGHKAAVTGCVIVGRDQGYNSTILVTGGWDSSIYLWDIEVGKVMDRFKNHHVGPELAYKACGGAILDMDYSPQKCVIGYVSSDHNAYLRRFSLNGTDMFLLNTLKGHEDEATCIRWNQIADAWITGSDDGTVRIWNGTGNNGIRYVLTTNAPITSLSVDSCCGAILAAVLSAVYVYDPIEFNKVQTYSGHTDAVHSILHIPEWKQYVTGGADGTIRFWKAWKMNKRLSGLLKEELEKRGVFSDLDTSRSSTTFGSVKSDRSRKSRKGKTNLAFQSRF